jgi:hypothetical protein
MTHGHWPVGPEAHTQATLVQRPGQPRPWRAAAGDHGDGAPAWEKEGEGVQGDRSLTRRSIVGKVWLEEGWQRRNRR